MVDVHRKTTRSRSPKGGTVTVYAELTEPCCGVAKNRCGHQHYNGDNKVALCCKPYARNRQVCRPAQHGFYAVGCHELFRIMVRLRGRRQKTRPSAKRQHHRSDANKSPLKLAARFMNACEPDHTHSSYRAFLATRWNSIAPHPVG